MRNVGAIVLAATVAASAVTQATYVRAATKYDGAWSVVIYTRSGPCDAAYRFSGQITNGIISYNGAFGIDFTGRVRAGRLGLGTGVERTALCGGERTHVGNARRRRLARPGSGWLLRRDVGGDAKLTRRTRNAATTGHELFPPAGA